MYKRQDELCPAAGVFTQNVFCAAPVTVSREHLEGRGFGLARALVVNSGIANAATGTIGLENARLTAAVSYTHLRAHETRHDLVCRLLLEKKKKKTKAQKI